MSRLLRTNLATNPTLTDPYGEVSIPVHAGGGTAPGVRVLAGSGMSARNQASARGGATVWATEQGARIAGSGSGNAAAGMYPGRGPTVSGDMMRRTNLAPGRSYAAAVLYSQDSTPTSGWTTEGSGRVARTMQWLIYRAGDPSGVTTWNINPSNQAPNTAGVETLLVTTYTIPTDVTDAGLSIVYGNALSGTALVRRLIICEGDTEEQALAAVTSGVAFP